jgi:hypothetical protein
MPWATVEQVTAQTGVTVTPETLALASSIIDTFSGADEELPEDAISLVDRKHLRRATAWQAAWIPTKPGLVTDRENAETTSSDSQTISRADNADGLLAPLAKRALMSLSWVGTRTAIVRPVSDATNRRNFLNERSDPAWLGGEGAIP